MKSMKSKSSQDNRNYFDKKVEGKILEQKILKKNYKTVCGGLIAIILQDGLYRIGTGGYIITNEKFETIKDAEKFINNNPVEIAIRAAVCITKKMNNGN